MPTNRLSRYHIFLVCPARDNPQRIIRQGSLQRLGLIPRRAHPDVAFFLRRQDDRLAFGWIGSTTTSVPSSRSHRPGEGRGSAFDLVSRSPLNSVQSPPKANIGQPSLSANHTTSFFLVSGFDSGAYSAKLLAGTRLVTCGTPARHYLSLSET